MKLSTKNLLIILVVLLVAFAAVQLTKRTGKTKSLKSELVSFTDENVTKIELGTTNGTISIEQEGEEWRVTSNGETYSAKRSIVETLISNLKTIKPGRLAARKEAKWKDYQVDSTGTRVTVFEGEDPTTDIIIGRFGVEGQRNFYTFVRLAKEANVYVANGFMKMSIYESANDYRNNDVLRLKQDSLESVQFDYPDSSFVLSKENSWFVNEAPADSAAVVSYLNGLRSVTSKQFGSAGGAWFPSHKVTFNFSNSESIVIEASLNDNQEVYRSSENTDESFVDNSLKDKIFRGRGVFSTTLD